MLVLHLMRHAKAARPAGVGDRDRPLNDRGREDAAAVAAARAVELGAVEHVLCSTALRTRQTLDAVRPWLSGSARIDLEPGLYLAGDEAILAQLRLPGPERVRLLIGHNDGLSHAAARLAGSGPRDLLDRLLDGLPTSGFASYAIEGDDWDAVRGGAARLTGLIAPR